MIIYKHLIPVITRPFVNFCIEYYRVNRLSSGYIIKDIKWLIFLIVILIFPVGEAKAQSSPYLFPEEIENLNFPSDIKPQIQSFYWFNLGEYKTAKEYHDQSIGKQGILSNMVFERFSEMEKLDARTAILKESKDQDVVMFNSAHHTHTAYSFISKLLPDLKSRGFSHVAIEGFSDDKITEDGHLKISGSGYYNEPQFMKMIRSAIDLEFSVHGYGGSCTSKGEDCSRERLQAVSLVDIHSQMDEGKLLVIAGYDHINEREDHPYWGMAMAAEFKSITGIDPLTIEQAEMQRQSATEFDNPYRKAIGQLQKPVVLKKSDNTFWIEPGGDLFDLQVFHPAERYYKGYSAGELDESDRVMHVDSLMKVYGEGQNYDYPIVAQLYLKDEWDQFKEETAPYDVALITGKNDPDNYLILPTEKELIFILKKKDGIVNLYFDAVPMKAVLVNNATIFRDHKWEKQDFYIVDGAIRYEITGTPSDTIDLKGKYITPGFADGHTHNLDRTWQEYLINQYLSEGTLIHSKLNLKICRG